MRIKALLCAVAFAAGIATTLADNVYSLNVVGYYNVTVPGYNNGTALNQHSAMVANQFNTTNNSLNALLPTTVSWNGLVVNKYFTGAGFSGSAVDDIDNVWVPNYTLNPGESALFVNGAPQVPDLTITFVGEVPQGTKSTALPQGLSAQAQFYPKAWALNDTDTGFPTDPADKIYKFIKGSGFSLSAVDEIDGTWSPNFTIAVGEGILVDKKATTTWTRSFTVGP